MADDLKVNGDACGVPAVSRMLDIVEMMAEAGRPYGINEIARELRIPVNSAFRILKCLEARGYVEAGIDGSGYQLSTSFFTLGMKLYTRFEMRRRSRLHLEWLSEETGETSQINVPRSDCILVLDVVTPSAPFYLQVVPGTPLYYHANAMGKVVLAFQTQEQVCAILPEELDVLTSHTITSRAQLMESLAEVRSTGIAYDREEYNSGVYCIGSPVFDLNGDAVAGVGITGLVSRFHAEKLPSLEDAVLTCAERISWDIGYRGSRYQGFREKLSHSRR